MLAPPHVTWNDPPPTFAMSGPTGLTIFASASAATARSSASASVQAPRGLLGDQKEGSVYNTTKEHVVAVLIHS